MNPVLLSICVAVIAVASSAIAASLIAIVVVTIIKHSVKAQSEKAQSDTAVPSSSLSKQQVRREFMMSYISTNSSSSMPESELVGASNEYGTLLFVTIDCQYNLQVLLSILAQRHQSNKFVVLSVSELQPGALDGTPPNEVFVIQPSGTAQTV